MKQFKDMYPVKTNGQLTMFDRIIFKGHLTGVYPVSRFASIMYNHGVLLKEFKEFSEESTKELKEHLQQMADAAGRPLIYLPSGRGKKGESKEELARQLAIDEGVDAGLIAIYYTLEMQNVLTVRRGQLVSEKRKHLHYYLYFNDEEFGLMFVRIQSWWPFTIHIYINGHEWLSRRLQAAEIGYEGDGNYFYKIDDLERAQKLCDKFAHRQWERVWNAFAKRISPRLALLQEWTGQGYYWTVEQAEIATDIMFQQESDLEEMMPALLQEMFLTQSAEDVMRFLQNKLSSQFHGEVKTNLRRYHEGWRVKHWADRNSIKMYNHGRTLRIETTINNAGSFKIPNAKGKKPRWKRMPKGVSYFWHFRNVGAEANQRYIDALCDMTYQGKAAIDALDSLCQPHEHQGRHVAKFQPVTEQTCRVFAVVLQGTFILHGFRNRDLRLALFGELATDEKVAQRRRAAVSRLLVKLRGHGLIEKVAHSHLYRVTSLGFRTMAAAIRYRYVDYPVAFASV